MKWAKCKARDLGVPLISKEVGISKEEVKRVSYTGDVQYLGGGAPFVYSDALGGILNGPCTVKGFYVL